ncbi:uncharacterized protein LOC111624416 [Centruroides sculpturatus]|uniref:uncharacterized protein LOC111624416 n=1 Tax=Centruroides sculpturatus TaxID=218467 RepID=UPI000C6E04F0|nr:uncharacterized protein LOC111624416 [Centruroides sculpturatus]
MSVKSVSEERNIRKMGPNCIGIVLCRRSSDDLSSSHDKSSTTLSGPGPPFDGYLMYEELVHENMQCFWNPCLLQSMAKLHYRGYLVPDTILVDGSEYTIEVVRSAWRRRVLLPPQGYEIESVGDIDHISVTPIPQTQFAPLPEAVCKVIYDLNSEGTLATCDVIAAKLETSFPCMAVPGDSILYRCLGELIRERKLYHNGHGYSVVTPDTYRRTAVLPGPDRQLLMTNEEAIMRMHAPSRSTSVQTDRALSTWSSADRIVTSSPTEQKLKRSYSLRILRPRDVHANRSSTETTKKEKVSVFSRWFRRKNHKHEPPPSTATTEVTLHSRSTQTKGRSRSVGRSSSRSSYRDASPSQTGSRSASLPRRTSSQKACPLHGGSVRKTRPVTYNGYREGWSEKLNNGDLARRENKPLNITNNEFRRLTSPPQSPGWNSPASVLVDRLLHPSYNFKNGVNKPVEENAKRAEVGSTDCKPVSKPTPIIGNSIDVEMTFDGKTRVPSVVSNIETSWNQTLRPGTTTIVTNVSTNVSRVTKDKNTDTPVKSKLAEAKAAFFSDKQTDCKDDSGFSSVSSQPVSVAL